MDVHAQNRRALMKRLPDGLIVLATSPEVLRNGDVHYPYRQESNFLYLTGIEDPGYALLLDPRSGSQVLFVPKLTQEHAVWLGEIPDLAEARRRFGIAQVRYAGDLAKVVRQKKKGRRVCYANQRAAKQVRAALGKAAAIDRRELGEALSELRAVKGAGELSFMARANRATAAGHLVAMAAARPGLFEYEVQAELEREFRRAGCEHTAYPSIVAGGKNSAVLHYHANEAPLKKGDLLLIDAGAEWRGYAADVTRTFPISGKFSRRQRDVYEIVLEAQRQCIARCRPDATSGELHERSEQILAEGLRHLGLLKGSTDELVESKAVRVFYPHGLTHMLGLDVHDVQGGKKRRVRSRNGRLRFNARLEPGFVVTMEPGIYFIEALLCDPKVRRKHRGRVLFSKAEKWLGFGGVRIEDDVVVRASGPPRNLTRVPKEVADVEAACGG